MSSAPKAIVFDLFHTLTGFESEWSDLPLTCEVLGIDRRVWNDAITTGSRWRLAGEERDAYRILHRLARELDPRITEETIRRARRSAPSDSVTHSRGFRRRTSRR
jgi:hypothetical protein